MKINIISLLLLIGFCSNIFSKEDTFPVDSVVNIKVFYSSYNIKIPWQKSPPSTRSGQAIAIGPYELVACASLIKDYDLIQVLPEFYPTYVTAKVKLVDYDVNLCILEVSPKDISHPFKTVKFKTNFNSEENITLLWLTTARLFIKTRGRIEYPNVSFFKRSGAGFLYFQISSESSPEGYSEPVFQNNKVIGLIESFDAEKKSSSLLPSKIIIDFLARATKNTYNTIPRVGFDISPLPEQTTRKFLKIPETEKRGVLINDVYDFGSGINELKKGDVLMKIDGYDVDPFGNINHPVFGRLLLWFIISEYNIGNFLNCEIWREGKLLATKIKLDTFNFNETPISFVSFNSKPEYTVQGGYILQELSLDYFASYGKDWTALMDPLLLYYLKNNYYHKTTDKRRIVILNNVLRHPINQGYQHLDDRILNKINGITVKDLKHVNEIFSAKTPNGYFILEFDGITPDIVIPENELNQANKEIMELYSIGKLSSSSL